MSKGRKRPPTAEELHLWRAVTETVEPLAKPRPATAVAEAKGPPTTAKEKPPAKARPAPPAPAAKAAAPAKLSPPLSPIDRRTRTRLGRGSVAIDGRIDLHGMTQAAAERRLRRFLADAQDDEAKLVLVITGKGRVETTPGSGRERGVLRRMVPMWLAAPDMRSFVIGFDEAGPAHGGAGALYVRIRRLKERR